MGREVSDRQTLVSLGPMYMQGRVGLNETCLVDMFYIGISQPPAAELSVPGCGSTYPASINLIFAQVQIPSDTYSCDRNIT
jgi:hypothetical protein